jgi:hypothetical protein
MSFLIDKILQEAQALPDQQNWDLLEEKFRDKYREFQVYMSDPKNKTDERTPLIAGMDNELVELFNQLHDTEIVEETEITEVKTLGQASQQEENIETETTEQVAQNPEPEIEIETEDMKKNKNKKVENNGDALENNEIQTNGSNEQSPVFDENVQTGHALSNDIVPNNDALSNDAVVEQTQQIVEQPQQPVTNPYAEFEAWANTQETVSAKQFVSAGIPPEIWKENKPEFSIGSVKFRKFLGGLMFNRWEVIK